MFSVTSSLYVGETLSNQPGVSATRVIPSSFQAGVGVLDAAHVYSPQVKVRKVSAMSIPPPSETEKRKS